MTIVMLLLLGTGVIMVASALDDTPIIATFQKIVSGQAINIGAANTTAAQTSNPPTTTNSPPTVTL
jgi:hypothetical protein